MGRRPDLKPDIETQERRGSLTQSVKCNVYKLSEESSGGDEICSDT
jgi:hypothetical protein